MKDKVEKIVTEALQDINEDLESETLENPNPDTKLFGEDGALDSLALVSVITEIEEAVQEEFGKHITIADEKAMSLKHSPFATVGRLVEYVDSLLEAS